MITVTNNSGVELPATGGIGTNGITLLGIVMAATAAMIIGLKVMIEKKRTAKVNAQRRNYPK